MALSDWDRKYLNSGQQRAVLAYTDAWEKANRAGDTAAMERAHAGAEAIRRQAGYSGGTEGAIYAPSVSSTSTAANARRPERVMDTSSATPAAVSTASNSGIGYDNGMLTKDQVKAIQAALGVTQDGFFGAQTSAAAQKKWGVSGADDAQRALTSSRTSYSYDGNSWSWNGQRYTSQEALVSALNKANLGEGEKNALATAMHNAGGGVAYENGRFVGTQRQQQAESVKPQQSTGYVNPLAPGRNGSPSAQRSGNTPVDALGDIMKQYYARQRQIGQANATLGALRDAITRRESEMQGMTGDALNQAYSEYVNQIDNYNRRLEEAQKLYRDQDALLQRYQKMQTAYQRQYNNENTLLGLGQGPISTEYLSGQSNGSAYPRTTEDFQRMAEQAGLEPDRIGVLRNQLKAAKDEMKNAKIVVEAMELRRQGGEDYEDAKRRAAEAQQKVDGLEEEWRALDLPGLGERIGRSALGYAEQAAGGFANAAGTAYDLNRALPTWARFALSGISENTPIGQLNSIYNALGPLGHALSGAQEKIDYATADALSGYGAKNIERAKEGASEAGKVALDVIGQGVQMGGDLALAYATGGGALVPMAIRSFGSGAQEARQEGADVYRSALYGAASAAVEVLTEKMFNGLAGIYGAGTADKMVQNVIGRITKNEGVRAALNVLVSAGGEGAEELLSGLAAPALKTIYNGKSLGENYSELEAEDLLYDVMIGSLMGMVGGTVDVARDARETRTDRAIDNYYDTIAENGLFSQQAREAGQRARDLIRSENRRSESIPLYIGDDSPVVQEDVALPLEAPETETTTASQAAQMQNNASPGGTTGTKNATIAEHLQQNMPRLAQMEPVAVLTGNELSTQGKASDRALAFLQSIGNKVNRSGFGDVFFSRKNVKNSLVGHGMSQAKIETIAAVPAVIQRGIQLDHVENYEGRGYDTYIFAAPVNYRGYPVLLGVVVAKDQQSGRYYVHEVVDSNGNKLLGSNKPEGDSDNPFTRNAVVTPSGSADSIPSPAAEVNMETIDNKPLDFQTAEEMFPGVDTRTPAERGEIWLEGDPRNEAVRAAQEAAQQTRDPLYIGDDSEAVREDVARVRGEQAASEAERGGTYMDAQTAAPTDADAPARSKKENRPTIAKKDLRKALISTFAIPEGRRATFGQKIDAVAEEILRNGEISDEHRQEIINALYDAGVATVAPLEEFADIRRALKGQRIYVNDSIRADLGDNWNAMRQQALANGFYLVTDPSKGEGVDVIAQELSSRFGASIDNNAAGSTQLEQIIHAAKRGKGEKISLREEAEMLEQQYGPGIVEDQIDNLERQFDQAIRSFADKAGLEVWLKNRTDERVENTRDYYHERMDAMRQHQAERLEREKQAWRDAFARRDDARRQREAAAQTLRNLKRLRGRIGMNDTRLADAMDMLTPEEQQIAREALGNISTNAQRLTERAKARMQENAERYEELSKDPNYIPDKKTLTLLERMDQKYLADMSVDDLMSLHRALQSLEQHLTDMNKEIGKQRGEEIGALYRMAKGEIQGSKGRQNNTAASKFMDSQLTPMNYIEMLGGWNPDNTWTKSVARQLEEGERARKEFVVEANDMLRDFREEKADWIAKSDGQGKDAIWYDVEVPKLLEYGEGHQPIFGETVTVHLTPSMRVELARGIRNSDNLRHAEGGITFPDKDLYAKGQRKEAYNRGTTLKLAPETMKKLFSFENLSPEEKELFALMDDFFDVKTKNAINETSQIMDGVDRALSNHYSKIYTNANYRSTDATKVDESIGGMGSLQKRVFSRTPMLAMSVWEAFDDTVDVVGKYYGLAIPTRNVNMLLNWTEQDGGNSMKNVLSQKWGGEAVTKLENLLGDLQNRQYREKSGFDALANSLLNSYVTATFGANPGIVLKQFSSFPAAASVLGWGNIPKPAQIAKTDEKLIAKYTPELTYRSMGYATPELAELKNNPNWTQRNKVTRFIFGGAIQGMDSFTVKSMWPWAENYVKNNFKDLQPGSDAFYQKTAEVFNDAVTQTQPMYDVMHRANIMQNPSELTRAVTMFKTVPLQQQNMLRKALGEAQAAEKSGDTEKTSHSNKNLVKTIVSIAMANLLFEGIEFANQALKNGAKKYRDDDDELTLLSFGKEIGASWVKDAIGMFVGGDVTTDIVDGILGKTRYYAMEAPGISQLNDVIESIVKAGKGVRQLAEDLKDLRENGGSIGEYVRYNGGDLLGDMKDLAENIAMYTAGVPVANIEKYLLGTLRVISPEAEQAYKALFDTTTKRDLTGMTGGTLRARVSDLLGGRVEGLSSGTIDELARLYESTGTEVIPSDVSSKYSASQEQVYRRVYGNMLNGTLESLVSGKLWQTMNDEERADALTALYRYAADEAKSATMFEERTTLAQTVSEMQRMGLAPEDYFAIKGKLGSLEPENGASSVSKMQKYHAIADMDLTDDEKLAAIGEIMGTEMTTDSGNPSQYAKMLDLINSGLSVSQYVDLKETHDEINAGSGSAARKATLFADWVDDVDWLNEDQKAMAKQYLTFSTGFSAEASEKALSADSVGLSIDQYFDIAERVSSAASIKDDKGKTITNSESLRKMQIIYSIPDLTAEQRQYLFEKLGVGKTVRGYSSEKVNAILAELYAKYAQYNEPLYLAAPGLEDGDNEPLYLAAP